MKSKKGRMGLLVIFLCLILAGCASPLKKALKPIQDNYKVELLIPPKSDLIPGWTYRPKDLLILNTKCYDGDLRPPSPVLDLKTIDVEYKNNSSIASDWKGWMTLKVKYDRTSKIKVLMGNFQEVTLTDVRPTFDPSCLIDDYVPDRPIIGLLLRVSSIEVEFYDTTGEKVDLTLDKLKELAAIDISGEIDISQKKNLTFSGKDLYVGFKKLNSFVRRVADKVMYTRQKDGFESQTLKYQLFIKGIEQQVDGWRANVRILNNRLQVPGGIFDRTFDNVARGDTLNLIMSSNRKDYMHVKAIDAQSLQVEFISYTYRIERGVRILPRERE